MRKDLRLEDAIRGLLEKQNIKGLFIIATFTVRRIFQSMQRYMMQTVLWFSTVAVCYPKILKLI